MKDKNIHNNTEFKNRKNWDIKNIDGESENKKSRDREDNDEESINI